METPGFNPPPDGYRKLLTYRKAEVICDITFRFCHLRVRDLPLWTRDSKEAESVRRPGRTSNATSETYRPFCDTRPAEVVANVAVCPVHQTNSLLDGQLRRLEADSRREGGLRDRMIGVRLQHRAVR